MDKYNVRKDVFSGKPMNNVSKEGEKTKCHSPTLRSNSYGNVCSRYLRDTTGSCHDLCKNGRKHGAEHDGKRLTFGRLISNSTASEDVHILVKDLNVADGKKKYMITTVASDTCKVAEQYIEPKNVEISDMLIPSSKDENNICYSQSIVSEDSNPHTESLTKEFEVPDNSNIFVEPHSPSHESTEPAKEIQEQAMDDENDQPQISPTVEAVKNTDVGLRTLLPEDEKIEISPQVIHSEPGDEEINHVKLSNSWNNKPVNKPKDSVVPKLTRSKSSIPKQRNPSASTEAVSGGYTSFLKEKVESSLKDSTTCETIKAFKLKNTVVDKIQSSNQNAFFSPKNSNGSTKTATSLTVRSQMNASRSLYGPTNPDRKLNNEISDVGGMKSLKSQKAAISSRGLTHSAAVSLMARKSNYVMHATLKKTVKCELDYGDILKKKLEADEPKSLRKSLEPNQESLSKEYVGRACESAVSEVLEHSLSGTVQKKHQGSSSKEGVNRRPRKLQAVPSANGSSSPYRLKFKRGKLIELRATEIVGPRTLRFRRGRDLGENTSGEFMKRIYRRKRDIGDSSDLKSETHDFMLRKANLESKGVKLKHQGLQGKKKIQALFNHVIEETANKLVETRKSKVKALVGAFETVILLQERKTALV